MKRHLIIAALTAVIITFIVYISASDTNESGAPVYRNVKREDMKIALTFDDGPHPYYTEQILDILEKYNVKATFFFVGQNIEYYPEAAERVQLSGHEIGNHTYTHHRVRALDHSELMREIEKCDDAIYRLSEYKTRLFRPPEGAFDSDARAAAGCMDYSMILWSIDTRDWEHTPPDTILKNVTTNIKSGDIILMHDYIGHDSPTPAALEMMIPALIDKGYTFVTVSELVGTE